VSTKRATKSSLAIQPIVAMVTTGPINPASTNLGPQALGYEASGAYGQIQRLAAICPAMFPGFPDWAKVAKDSAVGFSQFVLGVRVHYGETHTVKYTRDEQGRYALRPDGDLTMDTAAAFAYTSKEFGDLKTQSPTLYAIVGDYRTRFNKHLSQIKARLVQAHNAGQQTGARKPNLAFLAWLAQIADTIDKRAANAIKKQEAVPEDIGKLTAALRAAK
jgi:hypothetical protein